MVEEKFSRLLEKWSGLLPGGVGGALDEDRLRRAMRSAFELGVAAHARGLVAEKTDEHGLPLTLDDHAEPTSNTVTWPCPEPGRYGLLFKAWRPGAGPAREPTDAMVEFGWDNVDRSVQRRYGDWHGSGVPVTFPVHDFESTVLTVISQNTPVEIEIQAFRDADRALIQPVLRISLQKNQATRRVLAYALR